MEAILAVTRSRAWRPAAGGRSLGASTGERLIITAANSHPTRVTFSMDRSRCSVEIERDQNHQRTDNASPNLIRTASDLTQAGR